MSDLTNELPGAFDVEDKISNTSGGSGGLDNTTHIERRKNPDDEQDPINISSIPRNDLKEAGLVPKQFPLDHVVSKGAGISSTSVSRENTTEDNSTTAVDDNLNTPDIVEDTKSLGNGLLVAATAIGLAAKDAAVATKNAAIPATKAATEKATAAEEYVRDKLSGTYSSLREGRVLEKDSKEGTYRADRASSPTDDSSQPIESTAQTPSAGKVTDESKSSPSAPRNPVVSGSSVKDIAIETASQLQSGVENLTSSPLGRLVSGKDKHATAGDIVPQVPSKVKDSIERAGLEPEATAKSRAGQHKSNMESELMDARKSELENLQYRVEAVEAKTRKASEEPATKKTMDAEPRVASNGTPQVTTGVQTSPADAISEGTGTGVDTRDKELMSHAEDPGTLLGQRSTDERRPTRAFAPPVDDNIPVRTEEEVTVGNDSESYKKLSSGTLSGVRT